MKNIRRSEVTNIRMVARNEKKYSRIIMNNHVHNWVGFGWIDEGKATTKDKQKYPEVKS